MRNCLDDNSIVFMDPYITNTNNNGRADMYVLFQLLANFYSDEIKTGKNENGDLSLKLSDLAEQMVFLLKEHMML